jgi:hypothetical protein
MERESMDEEARRLVSGVSYQWATSVERCRRLQERVHTCTRGQCTLRLTEGRSGYGRRRVGATSCRGISEEVTWDSWGSFDLVEG